MLDPKKFFQGNDFDDVPENYPEAIQKLYYARETRLNQALNDSMLEFNDYYTSNEKVKGSYMLDPKVTRPRNVQDFSMIKRDHIDTIDPHTPRENRRHDNPKITPLNASNSIERWEAEVNDCRENHENSINIDDEVRHGTFGNRLMINSGSRHRRDEDSKYNDGSNMYNSNRSRSINIENSINHNTSRADLIEEYGFDESQSHLNDEELEYIENMGNRHL